MVQLLTYESLSEELFGFYGPVLRLLPLSAKPGCPYTAEVHPSLLPIGCIAYHQAVPTDYLTYYAGELVAQLGTCRRLPPQTHKTSSSTWLAAKVHASDW